MFITERALRGGEKERRDLRRVRQRRRGQKFSPSSIIETSSVAIENFWPRRSRGEELEQARARSKQTAGIEHTSTATNDTTSNDNNDSDGSDNDSNGNGVALAKPRIERSKCRLYVNLCYDPLRDCRSAAPMRWSMNNTKRHGKASRRFDQQRRAITRRSGPRRGRAREHRWARAGTRAARAPGQARRARSADPARSSPSPASARGTPNA